MCEYLRPVVALEITNALIAVHVTSQTLYTEITNADFRVLSTGGVEGKILPQTLQLPPQNLPKLRQSVSKWPF